MSEKVYPIFQLPTAGHSKTKAKPSNHVDQGLMTVAGLGLGLEPCTWFCLCGTSVSSCTSSPSLPPLPAQAGLDGASCYKTDPLQGRGKCT